MASFGLFASSISPLCFCARGSFWGAGSRLGRFLARRRGGRRGRRLGWGGEGEGCEVVGFLFCFVFECGVGVCVFGEMGWLD